MKLKTHTWYENLNYDEDPVAYVYITKVEGSESYAITVDLTPGKPGLISSGSARVWFNDMWPERQTTRFQEIKNIQRIHFAQKLLFEALFHKRFQR